MSEYSLTNMIGAIARRMLQDQDRKKKEQQQQKHQQKQQLKQQQKQQQEQQQESRPKESMDSTKLKLMLEEISKELEGRKFNTLNWQLAECQGLLEQFHSSNRKIYKDIKLIRQIIIEMRRRIDASRHRTEPRYGEQLRPYDNVDFS
ncbi:putative GATA zinc finger domain-containing protein 25 [Drosophila montana]|uniref:putative GATA zinc finger domain-containing protein 25 n=1 Tax=Drosophila montana TaxID=40370 RepID=UPI00313BDCB8